MEEHPSRFLGIELGPMDTRRRDRLVLFAFLIVTLGVGAAASLFTEPNVSGWYQTLLRPAFDPPGWLFAPVWTALYLLMAYAAWRVWRASGWHSGALALYAIQLVLTFAWVPIFFALHRVDWALIEILFLLAAVLATTIAFFRRERLAGLLFLPHLGWTGFAAVLNAAVWQLNGAG